MTDLRFILLLSMALLTAFFAGCSKTYAPDYNKENEDDDNYSAVEEADDYLWDSEDVVHITLNGTSATTDGEGVTVNNNIVTISCGGTYSITGNLGDGQIRIESGDENVVRIILNGADITCLNSSPIYVKNAAKVIIITADQAENYVTDGAVYVYDDEDDEEPNSAIFSKSYIAFGGTGRLTVNAGFADGITGKDGLVIKSGTVHVNAADDGIRGKDYIVIHDGDLTIVSKGDGLKSDNDSDTSLGYIAIEKGTINISSSGDALSAATDIQITFAEITIVTGGGSTGATSTGSAKGIKCQGSLVIEDGVFNINSLDDALHSDASVRLNGGAFSIATGDDAVHGDAVVEINGGNINITKCYEGLESTAITINSGAIRLTSSDDGVNGAGGPVVSTPFGPAASGNLNVKGGYIYINSGGDGLDINGSVTMSAGTVIIDGPTNDGNGAIDYDNTFTMTGGFIIAAGSSGMAMAPGSSSTQCSLLVKYNSSQAAGKLFHVQKADGTSVVTFSPAKQYRSVAFSSPSLIKGTTFTIISGGTASGTVTDGIYSDETCSGGTASSVTLSSVVTNLKLN